LLDAIIILFSNKHLIPLKKKNLISGTNLYKNNKDIFEISTYTK